MAGGSPHSLARMLVTVAATLSLLGATASTASALDVPVGQIHGVAQAYEPGVQLPTVFPKSIGKVDVGAGSALGNGPAPAHMLVYHAAARSAFQVAIWRGSKRAAVVKGLLFHDGAHGSTTAFRAGAFAGTLEVQKGVGANPRLVASYVWQVGGFTYLLAVVENAAGVPSFPGLKPLQTIASFKL